MGDAAPTVVLGSKPIWPTHASGLKPSRGAMPSKAHRDGTVLAGAMGSSMSAAT